MDILVKCRYGDVTLTKESSRIFCIFFIMASIGGYAWALGKFASIFMEIEQERQVRGEGVVSTSTTAQRI